MKYFCLTLIFMSFTFCYSQQLNLTGGISVVKGNIDVDKLTSVIQENQEEVFTRLFSNIIVKYFSNSNPENGIHNFPTYYSLYNIMTDLVISKSKTSMSKSVINSCTELAYIYSFVYYQQLIDGAGIQPSDTSSFTGTIYHDEPVVNKKSILTLNFYMEAAFAVLARNSGTTGNFAFTRSINSTEISSWYKQMGLVNDTKYSNLKFINAINSKEETLNILVDRMGKSLDAFKNYSGDDPLLIIMKNLKKESTGLETLKKEEVNTIKLLLIKYANSTDYLFDQNVVKTLLSLIVENFQFGLSSDNNTLKITQVYLDVESLITSLDKIFVAKNNVSSVSSCLWFINPRPFLTIGISNCFFLNNKNTLGNLNGVPSAITNLNLASEKIGLRFKVWDGGYTHSFAPGEVYKYHGHDCVWTTPKRQPLISSVYYNVYGSGLLYNLINLKTNQNFTYSFLGSNIGLIFFNGVEFSTGIGFIYQNGLDVKNSFLKVDFDIPILDYLSALTKKKAK